MLPILDVLRWCAGAVIVDDNAMERLANGRAATLNVTIPVHARVLVLNEAMTGAALAYPVDPGDAQRL